VPYSVENPAVSCFKVLVKLSVFQAPDRVQLNSLDPVQPDLPNNSTRNCVFTTRVWVITILRHNQHEILTDYQQWWISVDEYPFFVQAWKLQEAYFKL